jgi:6-phosphogluconate dehydrogenase
LQSFLIEITADIFKQKDDITGNDLVDMILDKAGSKGTGKWTSQEAMNLGISIPTIDIAVSLRSISAYKEERVAASELYDGSTTNITTDKQTFINQCGDALFVATLLCYAQGLSMLYKASEEYKTEIPLSNVVKIWRGGCIIRSTLLEKFYEAYQSNNNLPNILLDKNIAALIQSKATSLRKVIIAAVENNIAVTGIMSTLGYLDAYSTANMPTNLIQAQRDYFGAHTYQRTDKEGSFHTKWND